MKPALRDHLIKELEAVAFALETADQSASGAAAESGVTEPREVALFKSGYLRGEVASQGFKIRALVEAYLRPKVNR